MFEYLVWSFEEANHDRRVSFVNGVRQAEGPRLADALATAGADGWDLVNAYSPEPGWGAFVFKRPKAA